MAEKGKSYYYLLNARFLENNNHSSAKDISLQKKISLHIFVLAAPANIFHCD